MRNCMLIFLFGLIWSCGKVKTNNVNQVAEKDQITAKDILGNPNYLAMSYGGYRYADHGKEPAINQLKEDLKLLSAMGIKMLRTYKVHKPQAINLLKAISELESEANEAQILVAAHLANKYPDIVKVIAVGNEAMVKWAASYYVEPWIILKWVNYLQDLKKEGKLSKDLWITSSDNFASWGGGGEEYHVEDLNELIKAVDFISMHTYPMHDTHYQPEFWLEPNDQKGMKDIEKIDAAMLRAKKYAIDQYQAVKDYMNSLGVDKPIHIGETGWASLSTDQYGPKGSRASDEYKQALYYQYIRDWTNEAGLSCFYFEAFDEPWKGGNDPGNSEKHFGLFTVDGKAKYVLWDAVDKGIFKGLTRDGNPITKTFNGNKEKLMETVLVPPTAIEFSVSH